MDRCKMKDRKAIKFYRNYYEVGQHLPAKQQGEFYNAIFKYQFEGEEPKFDNPILNAVWQGIKPSLEKQVEGYLSKVGATPSQDPTQGGSQGGTVDPSQQGIRNKEEGIRNKEEDNKDVKSENDSLLPIDSLKTSYLENETVVNAVINNPKNKIPNREFLEKRLEEFNNFRTETGRTVDTAKEYASHFRNWNQKAPVNDQPTANTIDWDKHNAWVEEQMKEAEERKQQKRNR